MIIFATWIQIRILRLRLREGWLFMAQLEPLEER